MLIRFYVENYLSFNGPAELSFVPGKVRMHKHHIRKSKRATGLDTLRAAVIYGANASGKSNLVKALSFAQDLVSEGTKVGAGIPVTRFLFDEVSQTKPSRFHFEFRYGQNQYIFGFELDNKQIFSEWLYLFTKRSEKLLFERETKLDSNANATTTVELGKAAYSNNQEKKLLEFTAKQTRANQLFITECLDKNIEQFTDVNRWFTEVLTIIFPQSFFSGIEHSLLHKDDLSKQLVKYMKMFNTGVSGLDWVKASSTTNPLPDEMMEDIRIQLENQTDESEPTVFVRIGAAPVLFEKTKDGEIEMKRIVTKHRVKDKNKMATLGFENESDGTRRLVDLIPALVAGAQDPRVFVIDEIDRSLHPSLCSKFVELFLRNGNRDSQLVVTTHESSLLTLNLLRRDEIWFIEKDKFGESSLYSLEEFSPRHDKDIRRGYLMGRFGAIPVFQELDITEGDSNESGA